MKYLYKYILLCLGLPLLFLSCQQSAVETKLSNKPGLIRFSLNTSYKNLRAGGDESNIYPTTALERETSINKLYAVIYRTSSGMHYKTTLCNRVGSGNNQYEFDNERSGEFYFFLIANPDGDLEETLKKGPVTAKNLGELIAHQEPGANSSATNFLMTSEAIAVKVQSKRATILPDKIKLSRCAARFDFYNKIEGLEITKITFDKRYTSTHLFAQVNKMDNLSFTTDKVYTGTTLFQNNALLGTIYGYETDLRGETSFTLEGNYKGTAINPEKIRLENFIIKRNHRYIIILHELGNAEDPNHSSDKFKGLKYEIKVDDWSDDENWNITSDD